MGNDRPHADDDGATRIETGVGGSAGEQDLASTSLVGGAAAGEPPPPAGDLLDRLKAPLDELIKARLRIRGEGGRLGRYVILRLLGEGGMGSVFAAYDAELDRNVAIKLLRSDSSSGALDRQWLLGEAKAMARLSHPNVVQVYDVGEVDDHVFVAMELIRGETLRSWLKSKPRSWREIVEVFVAAGRGLAAVHAAGMVHRDFKPANVLIGDDGSVKVLDFGLANAQALEALTTDSGGSSLTSSRSIAGTPAYMPPEQHNGEEVDARGDLFAFSVALYEALFGERPFAGRDAMRILASIAAGDVRPHPRGSRVPPRIRRAIVRGLAFERQQRWPAMEPLLAALSDDPWRRRGAWLAIAALALILAALAWSLARQRDLEAERAALLCAGAERDLEGRWGDPQRQAIAAAFDATGLPYAAHVRDRVLARLDSFAGELSGTYRAACEEHRRGDLTDNLYERAQTCVDGAAQTFTSLTKVYGEADATVVEGAMKALDSLPRLEICRDRQVLGAQVLPPQDPAVAAAVEADRAALADAHALLAARKITGCKEHLAELTAHARELAYGPLLADALLVDSLCHDLSGSYEEAEALAREAMVEAEAAGHEPTAVTSALQIVRVVGVRHGRVVDGSHWLEHADGLIRRGGDRPEDRGRFLAIKALLAFYSGRPEDALAAFDEALPLLAEGRALSAERGATINNRGAALNALGRYDELEATLEESLKLSRELQGDEHPDVATVLTNLGNLRLRRGDLEGASAFQRESLAIRERLLGKDHPEIAVGEINLAAVRREAKEYEEARRSFLRALEIREATLDPKHPGIADALLYVGNLDLDMGSLQSARGYLERSLAINLEVRGPEHPMVATCDTLLGRVDFLAGRRKSALQRLERALVLREKGGSLPEDYAETRFFLAQALWDRPKERTRALELARAAATTFREAGGLHRERVEEIEAWLAARSGDQASGRRR